MYIRKGMMVYSADHFGSVPNLARLLDRCCSKRHNHLPTHFNTARTPPPQSLTSQRALSVLPRIFILAQICFGSASMPSGKKPVSCIPCAKRKVRCDKAQPCCHCKRRRQDECVYPHSSGVSNQLLREHTERVEKLESYIRSLGGNPKHADETRSPCSSEGRTPQEVTRIPGSSPDELTSASWSHNVEPPLTRKVHRAAGESELLAHDGGVTYIET